MDGSMDSWMEQREAGKFLYKTSQIKNPTRFRHGFEIQGFLWAHLIPSEFFAGSDPGMSFERGEGIPLIAQEWVISEVSFPGVLCHNLGFFPFLQIFSSISKQLLYPCFNWEKFLSCSEQFHFHFGLYIDFILCVFQPIADSLSAFTQFYHKIVLNSHRKQELSHCSEISLLFNIKIGILFVSISRIFIL